MANRKTQFLIEPAFEAGGLRESQVTGELQYEAGGLRKTQVTGELQYEAGGLRMTQLVIEYWHVGQDRQARVSGSGRVVALAGHQGCPCVVRIGGVCTGGLDVPETEIDGVPASFGPCADSLPIECT